MEINNKYINLQPNQYTPPADILIDFIRSHGCTAQILDNNLAVSDNFICKIIPISTRAVRLWLGY